MRARVVIAVTIALLPAAYRGEAQTPHLVADLNPPAPPAALRQPDVLTATGHGLYLFATRPDATRVLVRVQGGVAADVYAFPAAAINETLAMVAEGDRLFFTVEGDLWSSDGTNAGTQRVRDFPPNAVGRMTTVAGTVYFAVASGPGQRQLWRSDGTEVGTVMIATVPTSETFTFSSSESRVYFARSSAKFHLDVWSSDGTAGGTHSVGTDLVPMGRFENAALGDTLLIGGPEHGPIDRLWRTDGTAGSAVGIATFSSGAYTYPHALTTVGSQVLFGAGAPAALWRSDGTVAGTVLVKAGLDVDAVRDRGDGTALVLTEDHTGHALWATDGTDAGTVLVTSMPAAGCVAPPGGTGGFAALPSGDLVFTRGSCGDLWRTDGTAAGTVRLVAFDGVASGPLIVGLTAADGAVYFSATAGPGTFASELWRTDGTVAGTARVLHARGTDSNPFFLGTAGGHVLFGATRPDLGTELWTLTESDGTVLPIELMPGPASTDLGAVLSLGDHLLFRAFVGLWVTDGTAAGTSILPDLGPGLPAAANGGVGLFTAGERLWRTDGSLAATFGIEPPVGVVRAAQPMPYADAIAAYGGDFVVAMRPASGGLPSAESVWRTDGSREPATLLTDFPCAWVTAADERLFLPCAGAFHSALWISDGTRNGTRRLTELPEAMVPGWVASEGRLYFRLGTADPQLWTSDGTAAGTYALSSTAGFRPEALKASNGLLYFAATTPAAGRELWRTDGTVAGTILLRDVLPGPPSGLATDFEASQQVVAAGGGVVFAAAASGAGRELWTSDGTPAGTVPLPEIAPGPMGAEPRSLLHAHGRVYLSANDGVHGVEPWVLDLPPAVAIGDVVVTEGDAGTTTATFAVTLERPATGHVTVLYSTVAGSAQATADFMPANGVLTFEPGELRHSIDVAVIGDAAEESAEAFALRAVAVSGAGVADGRGVATILDDDAPRASVAGASVVEGDEGAVDAVFPVTLATGDGGPTASPVTIRAGVEYGTADVTDFPTPGLFDPPPTVTFPAGSVSGTTLPLAIPVRGDTLDEPNEIFRVRLDSGDDAAVPEPVTGVIVDDDGIAAAPPVEIAHGSRLLADLAPPAGRAADVDFYVMRQEAHASYEVAVDGVSGDAVPLQLERVAPSGSVVQAAQPVGTGSGLSLRWIVGGGASQHQHLRVRSAACGSGCGTDDVYRLRVAETTLTAARVNNTGPQTTVVLLQNASAATVTAEILLWSSDGLLQGGTVVTIAPRATAVVDTNVTHPSFTGSLTVANDAPYGALAGKVVSFDHLSGFTFDSPLTYKPR